MDRSVDSKADAVPPGRHESAANAPLLLLLSQLEVLPDLRPALADIKAKVERAQTEQDLAARAAQIASLINRQSLMQQDERAKLVDLLHQMGARLDQLAKHLHGEALHREAADKDGAQLNKSLQGEVREISAEVQRASSLSEVQDQVSRRISHIGEQLDQFRQRESARLQQYKERTEMLRSRVDELEHHTRQLQDSVQREQTRSMTDALTGIPNRLALEQRMREEQARIKAGSGQLCVAIWDVDHFKGINDRYGHPAGDKVLRVFAQHLSRHQRQSDFVARYGGEEFVTIIPDVSAVEALRVLDRVRKSLRAIGFHFDGQKVCVTASCGVSVAAPGEQLNEVLKRADSALYRAKSEGRDRCCAA